MIIYTHTYYLRQEKYKATLERAESGSISVEVMTTNLNMQNNSIMVHIHFFNLIL